MSSFFSRLAGGSDERYDEYFEDERPARREEERQTAHSLEEQVEQSGELAVDVYQTPDSISIKTLIAGVQPATIDISLTREMVTISGSREDEREIDDGNYYHRELFWGSFSRTVILPEEVDVDHAEASEKHGVLTVRLPKINKSRETKLKVRSR